MEAADSRWNHWRNWLRDSNNGRILAAMLIVGGLSLVVNVAVIARELVLAAFFGVSDALAERLRSTMQSEGYLTPSTVIHDN